MNAELVFHLLEKEQVEAVLVGGLAAVAHGAVYMTNDIDLCYNPASSNLTRLVRALEPIHPRLRVEGMADEQASARRSRRAFVALRRPRTVPASRRLMDREIHRLLNKEG
jgi:hypothetical protein